MQCEDKEKKPGKGLFYFYFGKMFFRVGIFVIALVLYIVNKDWLDFTSEWTHTTYYAPTHIFWLLLMGELLIQLNPKSKVSKGCLKQFPQHYALPKEGYDPQILKLEKRKHDIGAIKVLVVWLVFNAVFIVLYFCKIISVPEMMLLCLFYYMCDLICVVLYCPFMHLLMKNRCCVNCRIFAWGIPMMMLPLIGIFSFFSTSLILASTGVALIWEIIYHRHPERFFEISNENLRCANCKDKMCKIKKPLKYLKNSK